MRDWIRLAVLFVAFLGFASAVASARRADDDGNVVLPKELVGTWTGTMYTGVVGADFPVTLKLKEGGQYSLSSDKGPLQSGTWHVLKAEKLLVMDPDEGKKEKHEYDLTGGKLTIHGTTGKMKLAKQVDE